MKEKSYDLLTNSEINELREEKLAMLNTETAKSIRLTLIKTFGPDCLHKLTSTQYHDIYTLNSYKEFAKKHIKNDTLITNSH